MFDTVENYRGNDERLFDAVLAPAMPAWSGFAAAYERYRRFASAPCMVRGGGNSEADLWTFYALSRVFEHLTLGIQDRSGIGRLRISLLDPNWPAPPFCSPSHDELVRFFGALGMERMSNHPQYHPFLHEIAAAELDPDLGDDVLVEEELWPGLWFGDLVFARAGVRVRCGPTARVNPAIATRSTLYFTWLRLHRKVDDLSQGWGHNSQWRTRFRRDYFDGAMLRYNVDGHVCLAGARLTGECICPPPDAPDDDAELHGDLTPGERIELLTHRCFVQSTKPDHDRWPFDDTYAEPTARLDTI